MTASPASELSTDQKMELRKKGMAAGAIGGLLFTAGYIAKQNPDLGPKVFRVVPGGITAICSFFI